MCCPAPAGGPQGMVAQQPGMGAPYGQQPGPGYQPGYQPSMAPPPQQPMTASPMMGPARSTMMPPSAVPPQSGLAPLPPAPAMQQWSHLSPSVAPPPPPPGGLIIPTAAATFQAQQIIVVPTPTPSKKMKSYNWTKIQDRKLRCKYMQCIYYFFEQTSYFSNTVVCIKGVVSFCAPAAAR